MAPTGADDSPNSQDLRIPTFSWSFDLPEFGDGSALGENKNDGQGEHDKLADHEEVQQRARSYVRDTDSYDQETDGDLPKGEPEHAEYLRYPIDFESRFNGWKWEVVDMTGSSHIGVYDPENCESQRPDLLKPFSRQPLHDAQLVLANSPW